jgi:hypothetical protein
MRARNNRRKFPQPFQHRNKKEICHQSAEQEGRRKKDQNLHEVFEDRKQVVSLCATF